MPKCMIHTPLARRGIDGLAQIGPTRFDVSHIRFVEGEDGDGTPPAGTPPEQTDEEFLAEHGFPRNTKNDDMTPEQLAAKWRNESKKQQKEADAFKKLGKTPAEIQKIIADAEAARVAALSDAEQAIEKAKQEGAAGASTKFLAPAIEGQVVALTRGADESAEDALSRVKGALKYIDVTKFLDANGDLDADEIQTFAQSLAPRDGTTNGTNPGDALGDVLQRQSKTPQGQGGSVKSIEDTFYASLSNKTTTS